ncbi:MAG: branched-chain amino acid ABC transporter permease [Alicyclobacillus macrosporangiidus]|uniref:branched-chain amino acid ABC transporter permease n=1 Tax=Alicyclobacillus macrosporangiidus TaxID=392015 RepID=UPI0026EC60E4|nr:branched-chain amino acid ABC transporter permease [Alicyclobacillus macrosporangiidus]MCL6599048.1 branched-chain amino acid ABC transporter permease [Alicyclobacillus macrosporangiidus]
MFLQTIVNGLLLGALYAIVGMGLSIVFGTMRIVNFAHGQFVMVGMYITYTLFTTLGLDPYVSAIVSFVLCFLLGMAVYRVAIHRIIRGPEMNHILLTAGIGLMLTNLAQMVYNTNQLTINLSYSQRDLVFGGLRINIAYLISFIIAAVVAALLFWFIMKTETGRAIRAISQNAAAAALSGIHVTRVTMLAFGLGIAVAGVAGTLLLPIHYVDPSVGDAFSLLAFIIVVLGGMGSILGSAIGGLLIGVIAQLASYYLGQSYSDVLTYIVFLLVLLFKPSGLLGRSRV